jgi:hypothetical protein
MGESAWDRDQTRLLSEQLICLRVSVTPVPTESAYVVLRANEGCGGGPYQLWAEGECGRCVCEIPAFAANAE